MTDTDKERLALFLRRLSALSERTGIFIGGCGCFGSPHVVQGTKVIGQHLTWNKETNRYEAI